MRKIKLYILSLCLSFLSILDITAFVYAMDITLAWDANTEPNLAGYKIYYGAESSEYYDGVGARNGDSPIDMPLDQDEDPDPGVVQYTLYDLPEGTYVMTVTAYTSEGLESGFSNEVSTASDEANLVAGQVSLGGTGIDGGGSCFAGTAAYAASATPKKAAQLLLIVLLALCAVAPASKRLAKCCKQFWHKFVLRALLLADTSKSIG